MDQKLLDALNNLGDVLEELADILNNKNKAKSDTENALQSGNLTEHLQGISAGIKSIKSDTQKILKNQETLINISKEKESKKIEDIENAGNPKSVDAIKKGTGSILLIAAAVLAIGTAFNIVGKIDILSVVSLALSITLMATAFEKVAALELGIKESAIASITLVMMATALSLSSHALAFISPITALQIATALAIAGTFAIIGQSMDKMLSSFKGLSTKDLVQSVAFLPLILPAIGLGLALASKSLTLIEPITLSQFFSSLMVGAVFTLLSIGMSKIISAFKDINESAITKAAISIPIIFTAMSIAIWASSEYLSDVTPIGLPQFLTALGISIVFLALSYTMVPIIKKIGEVDWGDILKMPVLFTTMSLAIMLSSHILSNTADISIDMLLKIAILGTTIAIVSIIMSVPLKILSNIGLKELITGGIAILAIAATVMITSHILSAGDYSEYPDVGWSLGVGISMAAFGLAAFGLGMAVFGPQALIFAAGLGAVLLVAGTIVAVSHILKNGTYDNKGMLEWATSTALLYAAFTPILLILGTIGLASSVISFFGPNPWEMAKGMMIEIADTIVAVSYKLQEGNYKGGPNEAWAKGISLAIGAFAPVYEVLAANSGWLSSGVSPSDMKSAIMTISEGIVDAAKFFAENTVSFTEGNYPSESWAKGVGGAIGAFAPLFKALNEDTGWFTSGEDVIRNITNGIRAITSVIVESAFAFSGFIYDFNKNQWIRLESSNDLWSFYPSENWINGVNNAIKGFVDIIAKSEDFNSVTSAKVKRLMNSLVSTASILFKGRDYFNIEIDPNYVNNISKNILDFNNLTKQLVESEGNKSLFDTIGGLISNDPITEIAKRIITLADSYDKLATSLIKMGSAMKSLNITDIRVLGGLTTQLVGTGTQIDRNQQKVQLTNTSTPVNLNNQIRQDTIFGKPSIEGQLEQIIKLLSNINTSAESIDTNVIELSNSDEISGPPTKR